MRPPRKARDFAPGMDASEFTSGDYNALAAWLERAGSLSVAPPLLASEGPGGRLLRLSTRPGFWATVSGSANPYGFQQLIRNDDLTFDDDESGFSAPSPPGDDDYRAYEVNGVEDLDGTVQWLVPGDDGDFRFQDVAEGGTPPDDNGSFPSNCTCKVAPGTLYMTSSSAGCDSGRFNSGTFVYGPTPAGYASLGLGANCYLTAEDFPDPLAGGARFRYHIACQTNQYFLTRVYETSPYGSPYRDQVLYTWLIGGLGNTCSPFTLTTGAAYPGSVGSCVVTIHS